MAALLLEHLPTPTEDQRALLNELRNPTVKNWRGSMVGFLATMVVGRR